MTISLSKMDFLYANSIVSVQKKGTYLPRITREACNLNLSNTSTSNNRELICSYSLTFPYRIGSREGKNLSLDYYSIIMHVCDNIALGNFPLTISPFPTFSYYLFYDPLARENNTFHLP